MLKLDEKLAELGLQPGSVYKDSFIFYRSFADTLRNLPANYKIALVDALMDFALDMKEPDFSGDAVLSAIWAGMAAQIAANWVRTLNGHKGKDFGYKGKDFGVKGGAPTGNQNARKNETTPQTTPQQPPKTTPNVNVNDNVNVNVNANDARVSARPGRKEVIDFCKGIGLTDDEAAKFYDTFDEAGWVDKAGNEIRNWKALAKAWATPPPRQPADNAPKPPKEPADQTQNLAYNFLVKEGIIKPGQCNK